MKTLAPLLLLAAALPALSERLSTAQLTALAQSHSPNLQTAILASFDPKELVAGTAVSSHGPDFFFAIQYPTQPQLVIDDNNPVSLDPVPPLPSASPNSSAKLWYATARISATGKLHSFHYQVPGGPYGGRLDLPAYAPDWYPQPGTPQGHLSDKITHTSKIYEGMKANYWIYVPAGYDPKTPAALMVFQDGEGYAHRATDPTATHDPDHGVLDALDNLIAQHKIPVMIAVFINPGSIKDAPGTQTYADVSAHAARFHRDLDDAMRSTEYDIVSDRYARYLRNEILADVGARYNLRKDAYSRAITGLSSGGICSFNAAWQMTGKDAEFSRVLTWIGSFTGIQWRDPNLIRDGIYDGGQDYPNKVMREPKRNLRIWLQDGSNDLIVPGWGDWAQANIRMANALKGQGYDFHLSFSHGTHNPSHGAAEFPAAMTWLWRNYDPTKTEETYQQEDSEKSHPYFRVTISSRDEE